MFVEVVEVRDDRDPSGTGRVRVRAYNKENDEKNIPDETLRWAHPILPITSITSGGVGHKPLAPPIGSVLVCIFDEKDYDKQSPMYFGCLVRSEKVDEQGILQRDPKTGSKTVVAKNASPDSPNFNIA